MKICCDVATLDLTAFFDAWGFCRVGEFSLNDYRKYEYSITRQMVDDTKAYIAGKSYPEPTDDITLIED